MGQESRVGIRVAALVTMRRNSETTRAVSGLGNSDIVPPKRTRNAEKGR